MTEPHQKRRAVFLDRDGTVNEEVDYLYRPDDFVFIPGAPEAIRLLNEAGFAVVIVTNQSGIGRGYYTETDLCHLHSHLDEKLAENGAVVEAYYFCPHHPEHAEGNYLMECRCRKPLPGMLLQAADELSLDLSRSFMVGDKIADVGAGINAGCIPVLVRTGYGTEHERSLPKGVHVCDDILAAAHLIIEIQDEVPENPHE